MFGKTLKAGIFTTAIATSAMAFSFHTTAEYTDNSVGSAGEVHDESYILLIEVEDPNISSSHHFPADMTIFQGQIDLGWGTTASTKSTPGKEGYLFVRFFLQTEIQDFIYGDNCSDGHREPVRVASGKVRGSDHFICTICSALIKIGLDDNGTGSSRIGQTVTDTAGSG